MAYPRSSNLSEYFMPRGSAALDIEAIDAAAAVHGGHVCVKRCSVKRLMFMVEVVVAADTTAPVVEFNRRPTIASATGEVALGTLTIPDGTAAGAVIYKDIDPVNFEVGDELSFELITQGADAGTATGDGYYGVLCIDDPEIPGNEDAMTASA